MDYYLSSSTIIKWLSFAVLVLFVHLNRRTAFLTLFGPKAPVKVELESPDKTPRGGDPPRRDRDYYSQETTIVFRIQDTLFRVHEDFLLCEPSTLWSRIRRSRFSKVQLNGSSDARAIVLDDIPLGEFRALLYYFYHERIRKLTRGEEVEYLYELLAIADRVEMSRVRKYAIKRLHNLQPPLPPLRRILLYQEYTLSQYVWLYPAVAELLERAEPLNPDEAREAGCELLQKIAMMREDLAPSRNERGVLTFDRARLLQYVSHHFEVHTRHASITPLPTHRMITE